VQNGNHKIGEQWWWDCFFAKKVSILVEQFSHGLRYPVTQQFSSTVRPDDLYEAKRSQRSIHPSNERAIIECHLRNTLYETNLPVPVHHSSIFPSSSFPVPRPPSDRAQRPCASTTMVCLASSLRKHILTAQLKRKKEEKCVERCCNMRVPSDFVVCINSHDGLLCPCYMPLHSHSIMTDSTANLPYHVYSLHKCYAYGISTVRRRCYVIRT